MGEHGHRDYKKEYKDYQGTPQQLKNRAERNAARRELEHEGVARKGDGKDVDHRKPLRAGGGNSRSNLREISVKQNRGWRRNPGGPA